MTRGLRTWVRSWVVGVVWLGLVCGVGFGQVGGAGGVGAAKVGAAKVDEGFKYKFKSTEAGAEEHPVFVYAVKIVHQGRMGIFTTEGHAFYEIKEVNTATGHISMTTSGDMVIKRVYTPGGKPDTSHNPGSPIGAIQDYGFARDVVIDEQGNVLKESNGFLTQLPTQLGSLWQLAVEPMPGPESWGKSAWQVDRQMDFEARQVGEPRTGHPGRETMTYTLGPAMGDRVPVTKTYFLKHVQRPGMKFEMDPMGLKGGGQFIFDTKSGMIKSLDMKLYWGYFPRDGKNKSDSNGLPITIALRLLDPGEAKKALADKQAADMAAAEKRKNQVNPPKTAAEVQRPSHK